MPARKRKKPGGGVEPTPKSAAQVFAERQQAAKDEQREASRVRREAQQREDRRRELTKAKDAAATRLKDVRRRGASGEARIEAEAAYRAAIDALIRDEQGLPPLSDEEQAAAVAIPDPVEDAEPEPDAEEA
jgi:hypothetical protein